MRPRNGDGRFRDQHPDDAARIKELEGLHKEATLRCRVAVENSRNDRAEVLTLRERLERMKERLVEADNDNVKAVGYNTEIVASRDLTLKAFNNERGENVELKKFLWHTRGLRFWLFISFQWAARRHMKQLLTPTPRAKFEAPQKWPDPKEEPVDVPGAL
jgi:hypothetical protein